jgi:hypothetical protein
MGRKAPEYTTPAECYCTQCGERCDLIALENEFDYSGTHCNNGTAGTHYPCDWGQPVSDCCESDTTDEPPRSAEDKLYM